MIAETVFSSKLQWSLPSIKIADTEFFYTDSSENKF